MTLDLSQTQPSLTYGSGRYGYTGTDGDDVILGTSAGEDINALGGDDVICAGDGPDKVDGGTGVDELSGGLGNDTLTILEAGENAYGDEGDDAILVCCARSGGLGTTGYGGEGNDFLQAATSYGEDGNDWIQTASVPIAGFGGAGNDVLFSFNGLRGTPLEESFLSGEDGRDLIVGQGSLLGGLGRDWLIATASEGVLNGGPDRDRCDAKRRIKPLRCERIKPCTPSAPCGTPNPLPAWVTILGPQPPPRR